MALLNLLCIVNLSNICFLTIIPRLCSDKPFTKGRCVCYLLLSFASNVFLTSNECQIFQGLLPVMCPRNFKRLFFSESKCILFISTSLEFSRWSHEPSTVFLAFFCRITSKVSSSSVMKLVNIHCHTEGVILHRNSTDFF